MEYSNKPRINTFAKSIAHKYSLARICNPCYRCFFFTKNNYQSLRARLQIRAIVVEHNLCELVFIRILWRAEKKNKPDTISSLL